VLLYVYDACYEILRRVLGVLGEETDARDLARSLVMEGPALRRHGTVAIYMGPVHDCDIQGSPLYFTLNKFNHVAIGECKWVSNWNWTLPNPTFASRIP
jgi:hypothetical protein